MRTEASAVTVDAASSHDCGYLSPTCALKPKTLLPPADQGMAIGEGCEGVPPGRGAVMETVGKDRGGSGQEGEPMRSRESREFVLSAPGKTPRPRSAVRTPEAADAPAHRRSSDAPS